MIHIVDVLTYSGLAEAERRTLEQFLALHDIEINTTTAVKEVRIDPDAMAITVEHYIKRRDGSILTNGQDRPVIDFFTVDLVEAPPTFLTRFSTEVRWDPDRVTPHCEPIQAKRYRMADLRLHRDMPPVQALAVFPVDVTDIHWTSSDRTVVDIEPGETTDSSARAVLTIGRTGDADVWVTGQGVDGIRYEMEADIHVRWPDAVPVPVPVPPSDTTTVEAELVLTP